MVIIFEALGQEVETDRFSVCLRLFAVMVDYFVLRDGAQPRIST